MKVLPVRSGRDQVSSVCRLEGIMVTIDEEHAERHCDDVSRARGLVPEAVGVRGPACSGPCAMPVDKQAGRSSRTRSDTDACGSVVVLIMADRGYSRCGCSGGKHSIRRIGSIFHQHRLDACQDVAATPLGIGAASGHEWLGRDRGRGR